MMSKEKENLQGGTYIRKWGPSTKFLARVGGPRKGSSSSSSVYGAVVQKKECGSHCQVPTAQAAQPPPLSSSSSLWELIR